MLTNYTWYMPLYKKEANEVVHAYLVPVYSKVDGSHKNLSDKETELKIKMFYASCFHLGNETSVWFLY